VTDRPSKMELCGRPTWLLVSFVRDSNVILYHTRQSTETVKNTSYWHNVIWNYTADSYTALVYKDYMVDTYTELVHKL